MRIIIRYILLFFSNIDGMRVEKLKKYTKRYM